MSETLGGKTSKTVVLLVLLAAAVTGCAKYKQKIASQATEMAALEDENKKLTQDAADKEAERSALASAKDECDAASKDLEAKIAEMEAELKSRSDKIDELEVQLEALGSGKDALSKDLAAKEEKLKELRKEKALAKKRLATLKNMLSKFKKLIASGKLNVKVRNGKMVLELPSAILFESGKADLSEDGEATLKEVAAVLAKIKNREFQVAGHTDSDPIRNSPFKNNWELSTARALSVVLFLEKNKVPSKNLSAAGYSEYQPTASNQTDKGKAENRRIEITLMPNLDELPDLSDLEKELKK